MNIIRRRVEIDAPLESVLSLTLDAERYPEFAPSIESTRLIWHDPANRKYMIRYESIIPVIKKTIFSEQEVEYDIENTTFNFREIKGALGRFEGYRKLFPLTGNRTAIESEVRYSFGGNWVIAAMVNKALEGVVKSNLENIQDGIKRLAESGKAESITTVLEKLQITAAMLVAQGVAQATMAAYGIACPEFA